MTISSLTRLSGPYAGTGIQTVYPFNFKVFAVTDLLVLLTDPSGNNTTQTLTSQYSVLLNSDQNANPGGSVTMVMSPGSGYLLTLSSQVPNLQGTNFSNVGNLYPQAITDALDRVTIELQQVALVADNALQLPLTVVGVNTVLPVPKANNVLAWNSAASALQNLDPSTLATVVAFGTANADQFTGTGAQTAFTLSANPGAIANLDISISGVVQLPITNYAWASGTTLTFTTPPPLGSKILIRYQQALPQGYSTAGTTSFTQGYSGAVATTVQAKEQTVVTTFDFMTPIQIADCQAYTYTQDMTAAMQAFFAAALVCGQGRIIAGGYKITTALSWELAPVATKGVTIRGDGVGNTILNLATVATAPALFIGSNTASALFYSQFTGFTVNGNLAGQTIQLGRPDYAGALNEFVFEIGSNNASANAANCAVEVNYMLNSKAWFVANCTGSSNGDAIRLRQAAFNTFQGSWSNALNSLHITGGSTYGNVFLNPDCEVSSFGAVIDVSTAINNTFIGGQWQNLTANINATAGTNNRFIGPNFVGPTVATGSSGIRVENYGFGGEVMGGLTVTPPTGDGFATLNALSGNNAGAYFQAAGINNWGIFRDTANNLQFVRYNPATGASLGTAAYLEPGTGIFTVGYLAATRVGFFGAGVTTTRPTVTGAKGGNAALTSLLTTLANLGLITDSST